MSKTVIPQSTAAPIVSLACSAEPHAAEADAELVRREPARHHALPAARRNASSRGGFLLDLAPGGARQRVERLEAHASIRRRATGRRRTRRRGTSRGPRRPSDDGCAVLVRENAPRGSSWLSTRLSQRGQEARTGAGVSAGGSGARGRSTSSRPCSSRNRLSSSCANPRSTTLRARSPSTARCPHATRVRTRRGSGGRDGRRRRLPTRRRRRATFVPARTCRPPCGSARPRTPGRSRVPRTR